VRLREKKRRKISKKRKGNLSVGGEEKRGGAITEKKGGEGGDLLQRGGQNGVVVPLTKKGGEYKTQERGDHHEHEGTKNKRDEKEPSNSHPRAIEEGHPCGASGLFSLGRTLGRGKKNQ